MIHSSEDRKMAEREFKRLGFDKDARWRISEINKEFKLCSSYPRYFIIPSSFPDEDLESVAKYRYFKRVPTAVWRHLKNGCFIVRSSQPTVGWFGWFRSELDENLIQSYVNNTKPEISERNHNDIDLGKQLETNNDDLVDNNDDLCDRQTLVDENEHDNQNIIDDSDDKTNAKQIIVSTHSNNSLSSSTTITTTTTSTSTCPEATASQQQQQHSEQSIHHNNQITTNNHNNNVQDSTKSNLSSDDREINLALDSSKQIIENNGCSEVSTPISSTETTFTANNTKGSSSTATLLGLNNSTINGNGISTLIENLSPMADSEVAIPTTPPSKMLIIDARSYTAAMANRAKGGGCECSEYYQRCEVQFMNLANIHSIRKSFHAIRSVCEAYSEQSNNWLSFLDNSRWLHHISGLLKSALLIVDTIDIEEKSILIHCSDGWDRTPQLVALAEIMLDPYYRTFDGFKTLVQREWLDFGHKFADRCGSNPCNEDPNERCPVFLQWLDCVQQLLVQYPKHFEFNACYLDKLNRHTYSNIFGTFSYNSTQERFLARVDEKVLCLWSYLSAARRRFRNDNYVPSDDILRPGYKVKELSFWKEVYLPPVRSPTQYITHHNGSAKGLYDTSFNFTRTVCK